MPRQNRPDQIRVLHLSTTLRGGAGLAAYRLHEALSSARVESAIWSRSAYQEQLNAPGVTLEDIGLRRKAASACTSLANRSLQRGDFPAFTPLDVPTLSMSRLRDTNVDIIHVHNSYNFVSLRHIFKVTQGRAAVIVTMHDERWYTGGCHYSGSCDRYLKDCQSCPQCASGLGQLPLWSQRSMQRVLQGASVASDRICFVAPSNWLAERAHKSLTLRNSRVERIANCISDTFFATPRTATLSDTIRVAWIPNKGEQFLRGILAACEGISGLHLEVLVPGPFDYQSVAGNIDVTRVDPLESEFDRARFFGSCHVTLMTTEVDNFPNVALESLSVGTPVIVTRAGGAHEPVEETGGGWITERDPTEVVRCLSQIRDDGHYRDMIDRAREGARQLYHPTAIARQHVSLYESLAAKAVGASDSDNLGGHV